MITQKKLDAGISYPKIENYPNPITGIKLSDLSDKQKSRVIFAMAYEYDKLMMDARSMAQDLVFLTTPVDGQ